MLRLIFAELWPVIVPGALYLLWQLLRRRRARRLGEEPPRLLDGPWFWALAATILVAVACLLLLGLAAPRNEGTHYTPKSLQDGVIKPGHLD